VKIDSPVMLTTNLNKSDGLTNGARGYVVDVDETRAIVWVKFHGDVGKKTAALSRHKFDLRGKNGAVPIQKMKATFKHRGSVRIQRSQFPLVLAYAITSHKSQGQTLKKVIVDFSGNRRSDAGSFYVAVTRVKKLTDLYLRQFDAGLIKTSLAVSKELSRLRSHARYELVNQPLYHDIFSLFGKLDSEEIRITYINVNGLLDADHIRDLESDMNLTSSDVLRIAETKIDAVIPDERVQIENFDIAGRFDYRERSMGMMLYVRRDRPVQVDVQVQTNHEAPKAQIVYITVNGIGVLFAYLHPSDSSMGLSKIEEWLTDGGEIVIGDLNIDYMKDVDRQKLERFAAENNLHVSKMGPTCNRAQLDHIMIPRFVRDCYKYYVQTFANMYSDHRAVSVRLSENTKD
jgi:exonuclease III